jgi:hypothetical protein
LVTPGSTTIVPASRSMSSTRFMRASEITIPSATGSAPPESPVPAPRATKGMRASLQILTTACTSGVVDGSATSEGVTRRPVRPSQS